MLVADSDSDADARGAMGGRAKVSGRSRRGVRHVADGDVEAAVEAIRAAVGTLVMGGVYAEPQSRPLCRRLADGVLEVLNREGV